MSTSHVFTLFFLILLLNTPPSFSADPPETSPSPAPEVGADVPAAPPSNSSSPSPSPESSPSPSPSPSLNSPPAPPPSDLAPESSPAPAPAPGSNSTDTKKSPAPAPAPDAASDVSGGDAVDLKSDDDSSGGMSVGKKAGIAVGVIASVCIVGFGALVCKKRQQNMRRARFGYDAGRDIL